MIPFAVSYVTDSCRFLWARYIRKPIISLPISGDVDRATPQREGSPKKKKGFHSFLVFFCETGRFARINVFAYHYLRFRITFFSFHGFLHHFKACEFSAFEMNALSSVVRSITACCAARSSTWASMSIMSRCPRFIVPPRLSSSLLGPYGP